MNTHLPPLEDLAPGLSHAQLLSRLTKALLFAKTNLQRLDLHAPFWDDEDDPFVRFIDKIIIETALLVFLAARTAISSEEIRLLIATLTQELSKIARSERTAVLLLRFPHTAVSLGIAHIVLSRLGNQDEAFDALLRRAIKSGHVEAVERLPFRSMDLRWIYGLLDADASPGFDDLIPHSLLATNAHPIYMNREDAYALTHGLMYTTDFGALPPPASLHIEQLTSLVDAALAWHIISEDMDLLGELLLSAAMLRQPWSPHAQFAWHLFAKIWDELEFLPGPSFEASTFKSLPEEESSSYAFRHLYHTNYVAGMLCTLLLRHPERANVPFVWKGTAPIPQELLADCENAIELADDFCTEQRELLQHLQDTEIPQLKMTQPFDNEPYNHLHAHSSRDDNRACDSQLAFESVLSNIFACLRLSSRAGGYWEKAVENHSLPGWVVAAVLSDATLIQAARHYNLPLLAQSLMDATHLPTPPSLTFLEATAFLIRQQLPCGAIGAYFLLEENLRSQESISITGSLANCLARVATYLSAF